jgi:hypothetical protein
MVSGFGSALKSGGGSGANGS